MESQGEFVDIFDEEENYIKTVSKPIARAEIMLRRGVDLFVYNSKGLLLIHKRSDTKESAPGTWDWRVGGWVLSKEEPIKAAKREAEEEIGARNLRPEFLFKYRYNYPPQYNDISYVYKAVYDGAIIMQKEEVAQFKWIDPSKFSKFLKKYEFTPNVKYVYEKFRNKVAPIE